MLTFADFAEYVLDFQLTDEQKAIFNEIYRRIERGEKPSFHIARGSARTNYLAILIPMLYEAYKNEYTKGE